MNIIYKPGLPDWPEGQIRTFEHGQSRFTEKTLSKTLLGLESEAERWGAESLTVFAEWSIGKQGRPLSDSRYQDPAVIVYVQFPFGEVKCFAQDYYDSLTDNIWAVAKTIDALRTIERHAGPEAARRASSGFAALPPPEKVESCWEVLEIQPGASKEAIEAVFRMKAKSAHPDAGGSEEAFQRLVRAKDMALEGENG